MQGAAQLSLATWQNFYVIIGTAAATLTGLMFVVISVVAGMRTRAPSPGDGIAIFSTPNVFHYCIALLIAALFCAPWQALWPASLLLGLAGLGGITYVLMVLWRAQHRQRYYKPVLEDWLWHTVFPLASYTTFVVSALILPGNPTPALFLTAAATMLLLFIGIHNAWDNVTYMVVELSRSQNKSQDESAS